MGPRRVLFFGWGAAAAEALRCFDELGPECAVLCLTHVRQADDVDLGDVCRQYGFRCEYTDDEAEVLTLARDFAPDLILCASYRKKIGSEVLSLCRDALNFHPSLLPKHRGCFASFWVIMDGDSETGVTCHRMVERFDEGHIVHQERLLTSSEDTSYSLYRLLLPITALCVRKVLGMIRNGTLPEGTPQMSMGDSSYHFRKLPYEGIVQSDWSDERVERFIRAMRFPGFEGAMAVIRGQKVPIESVSEYRQLVGNEGRGGECHATRSSVNAERGVLVRDTSAPWRVLFFGWGAAAAEALRCFHDCLGSNCEVLCMTHPEQAKDIDLGHLCREFGFQCSYDDRPAEILRLAREFAPALILSASYRKRISPDVLNLCADALNFHPSLLPRHRGCMSSFHVIFEGEDETGVTCHRMVDKFDEGRIIHQERMTVSRDDNSFTLYRMLLPVTALCVRKVLGMVARGTLPVGTSQTALGEASYHPRKLPYDGIIQPEWSDDIVDRFIRAMRFPGYAGAAVYIDGKKVFVDSLFEYRWYSGKLENPVGAAQASTAERDSAAPASDPHDSVEGGSQSN
eukprot:TRINITY_DN38219_c0_g1_i1.p1 TRINITY_DN38219_c0_g1~~TRINITY_DN38219_c0_g1_i1.p1  ORF type:complete len:579 (+),score=81.64 TRINITY_DN38219_c0_g1_i1:30-1739(+)